jgi:hypothetical protein
MSLFEAKPGLWVNLANVVAVVPANRDYYEAPITHVLILDEVADTVSCPFGREVGLTEEGYGAFRGKLLQEAFRK